MKNVKGNSDIKKTKYTNDNKANTSKQTSTASNNKCKGSKDQEMKEVTKDNIKLSDKKDMIKEIQKSGDTSMATEDLALFVELYENINKGDDIKALAICRLLAEIYPNNSKFKELGDVLFESLKNGNEEIVEHKMDPHMKLNANGEYEYMYSSDDDD